MKCDCEVCAELMATMRDVPEHLRSGLARYVVHHIKPGSFLDAVLRNDLFLACVVADDASLAGLRGICKWIYNHAPWRCHGPLQFVLAWCDAEVAPEEAAAIARAAL